MDLLQPMAAVVLVLGLLAGVLLFLRQRGAAAFHLPRLAAPGPRRMEVLERLALGPNHVLHLVRVADRSMVVATTPSSCLLLADLWSEVCEEKEERQTTA